jgi:predicted TIM-barrel fold metal-dependent hydrolase
VIIDFHVHIFPPDVREHREDYVRRDPTFAEMYASPRARLATTENLLRSMDETGVDRSVILAFAWQQHELCVRHNDYVLEIAAASGGRLIPFCMVNPLLEEQAVAEAARCAAGGALGLGELRPESQGFELAARSAGQLLAQLAERHNLVLLFHVTEPGGHAYPGKRGLRLTQFRRFLVQHPNLKVVGAHFGGGLPLEAAAGDQLPNAYVDTAAMPFLYDASFIPRAVAALDGRVLFGSDFPLVGQKRQMDLIRSTTDAQTTAAILGDMATRLLGL